ncbi:hypothetical protein EVAR_69812_1 [Eumeta japonica]|uniref:No apical meristem-associated C-terminal domain-containing protein n=1 Tax=Eumeta variegata TaxID=151549 RepID=A0A4C1Z4L6_EUMVA|nr:hypothetical protein EVAR_69812_1 [Eumeta japonica]
MGTNCDDIKYYDWSEENMEAIEKNDTSREKLGTLKVPKKKKKANRSDVEALMLQKVQVKRDLAEAKKKAYYIKSVEAMNKQSEALIAKYS